jgi:hypothetical protein
MWLRQHLAHFARTDTSALTASLEAIADASAAAFNKYKIDRKEPSRVQLWDDRWPTTE